MTELSEQRCVPCEGGIPALTKEKAENFLKKVPGWEISEDNKNISRNYQLKNFYHTMAFVNAIAYIANQENHHPDLEIGYNYCRIRYTTHAVDGLSENDFICAAKINVLTDKK